MMHGQRNIKLYIRYITWYMRHKARTLRFKLMQQT